MNVYTIEDKLKQRKKKYMIYKHKEKREIEK